MDRGIRTPTNRPIQYVYLGASALCGLTAYLAAEMQSGLNDDWAERDITSCADDSLRPAYDGASRKAAEVEAAVAIAH